MTSKIVENLINNINHENLKRFFQDRNSLFRYDKDRLSEYEDDMFEEAYILGEIPLDLIERIIVGVFHVTRELSERSGKKAQYDKAKKIIRDRAADAGIFVFIGEKGNFRFSLVYAEYKGTKVDYSNFRRYTYFVSPELTNKTFIQRVGEADFTSLESIKEAFSVEKVTNIFFYEFRQVFDRTKEEFERANKHTVCAWLRSKYTDEEYSEQVNKFIFTFLGRIIFLYFLLRKGWIEDKRDYIRKVVEDKNNINLYQDFFKSLFFDVFAKEPEQRPQHIQKKYQNTPYLNGGLFEHSDLELEMAKAGKFILFEDKFIRDIILNYFEAYNFTVDENAPDDKEVSIDPEMLGKVFENTLAEEERNKKGTFYTPREVVHFMVKDSIRQFLHNETGIPLPTLQELIYNDDKELTDLTPNQIRLLDSKLEGIKVLDPAVGSAAFPVEMMQVLIDLRKRLNVRVGKYINEVALKKQLIKNNLYGVDIDSGAIEIAKLRLWLALIVDYDKSLAEPLPNLDFQFRVGNSLQEKIDDIDIFNQSAMGQMDWINGDSAFEKMKMEMIDVKDRFYRTNDERERHKLKDRFDELEHQMIQAVLEKYRKQFEEQIDNRNIRGAAKSIIETTEKIERLEQRIKDGTYKLFKPDFHFSEVFDRKDMLGNRVGGFDIVIGNPPYGVKVDYEIRDWHDLGSRDSYGVFISTSLKRFLKAKGVLEFVVSDTWLTINSHKQLREQVLKNKFHKVIRLHQDCFDATVNPSIITITNYGANGNTIVTADLTNISTRTEISTLNNILYDLREHSGESTTSYAVYFLNQNIINKNFNKPIPIGSERNFLLTSDSIDKSPINYNNKNIFVRKFIRDKSKLNLLKLGEFAEAKKGLATGNNRRFYFKESSGRGRYNLVDKSKVLTEDELKNLTYEEKIHGIDINKYHGRYLVPLDKGVAANIDDDWLPNYYVRHQFYVDWSKKAVNELYHNGGMRNPEYQFQNGIAYSWTGFYAPTFRLNTGMVFDQSSSCIFQNLLHDEVLLGILNSKLNKYILKNFCDHTVNVTASVIEQAVICLPNENLRNRIKDLVDIIIVKQKKEQNYDFMNNEQKEIDSLVYDLYSFNKKDIIEVETWYARRYPKLAHLCDIGTTTT